MQVVAHNSAGRAERRSLAARLLDEPGFTWATLGTLLGAAADEAAGEAGAKQARLLVSAIDGVRPCGGEGQKA